jgi:hypothetical protein
MKANQLAWVILLPLLLNTAAAQQSASTAATNSTTTNNSVIKRESEELSQNKTNSPPNEITTRDGTIYKGVTVRKVDPDGLTIIYKPTGGGIGAAKLKFENLPDNLQKRYKYSPEKVAAYKAQQALEIARWRAQQQANAEAARLTATQQAEQDALEQQQKKIEELQRTVPEPPKAVSVNASISVGSSHWIKDKIDDGKIIQLEDGSLWQVSLLDAIDSALWLRLDNITVIEGNTPGYPYKLVNSDKNELVDVKPLKVASASAPISLGSGHWIKSKIDDGKIIQLEDDSLWQVSSLDVIDSALWLTLDSITVIQGNDPSYPYKLVNTNDKHLVNVKPLR